MGGSRAARTMFVVAVALGVAGATACGGSAKSSKTPTAVPSAAPTGGVITINTPVPGYTYVPTTPTAIVITDDVRTAVAAKGAVEMVPYADAGGRFTVKVPRGWSLEGNKTGLNAYLPGSPTAAWVSVYCLVNKDSISQIEGFDAGVMKAANLSAIPFDQAVPAKAGTIDAMRVAFTQKTDTVTLDRVFVYFAGNGCGWRVQLTAWPGLTAAELAPILDAMLSSFAFKP